MSEPGGLTDGEWKAIGIRETDCGCCLVVDSTGLREVLAAREQRGRDGLAVEVEAAIRLISPEHITPLGARQLRSRLP